MIWRFLVFCPSIPLELGDGSPENFQEFAGLDGPEVDVERVLGAGGHQIAAGVDGQTGELGRLGRREGAEVAVAHHVEGTHRTVQRRRQQRPARLREGRARHAGRVLAERHEAEARGRVPHCPARQKHCE